MKKHSMMRRAIGATLILLAATLHGAEVGIYEPTSEGGKSFGALAIRNTLTDAGIAVDEFTNMSLENLLKFQTVIILNTPALAQNEDQRWRDNLRAYVTECGGAIVFCHDAIGAKRSPFGQIPLFPEIVVPGSVERAAVMEVKVVVPDALNADFDYLPGYKIGQEVEHMYDDHFMFEQKGGTALLADIETEKVVVATGTVGTGRVVVNGLFGGNPTGLASHLCGIDQELMINSVRWCLDGDGLVITDPAKAKVAEWHPESPDMAKIQNKAAILGSSDYDIRHRARTKIAWTGLEHDFIPMHFVHVRDLSSDDYKLIVFFPPTNWQERKTPDAVFEKIQNYIKAGGKVLVFMPASGIGTKVEEDFLKPIGCQPLDTVRDNADNLVAVAWEDADGHTRRINDVPGGQWFTALSEPSGTNAEVIAYWRDSRDQRKSPAIIKTSYGYILNINMFGDHRLFTANAIAELVPELAPAIFQHLSNTFKQTKEQMANAKFSEQGETLRMAAEQLRNKATAAAQSENYTTANHIILDAEAELVKAYAVSMPSVKDEERLVWTHCRTLPDPEIICARLARAGFNGVAVTQLEGHYPSRLFEHGDEVDWMQKWVDAAHRHGLKIGVGLTSFMIISEARIYDQAFKEDWRVVPSGMVGKPAQPIRKGTRIDPCRSHPEVVKHAIDKSLEIMEKYPVSYIFYDYIRWSETCYCNHCRERFQKDTGLKIEKWPDDVMGKYQNEYNDWRAQLVTSVIRAASQNIARISPEIKMGAATFRSKRESWGKAQYWWEWCDYLDFISPMTYVPDNSKTEKLWTGITELIPPESKANMIACIAPPGAKGGSDLTRLQQIDLQRKYAPVGVLYFWYHGLSDAFLDLLRIGPWRDR